MGEKFTTQCATKVATIGFSVAVGYRRAIELNSLSAVGYQICENVIFYFGVILV